MPGKVVFNMAENKETRSSALHIRSKRNIFAPTERATVEKMLEEPKRHPGESLMKNMAVAAALVLCVVTLRTGAIPSLSEATDLVMTAATDQTLLDDQLGKLSFVSAMFPEAVLVFGEHSEPLALPVSGGVINHCWSEEEPYVSWTTNSHQISSATDGEVMGVYHGNGAERIIEVMSANGMRCYYGNIASAFVETGDYVETGASIGTLLTGADFVFEVRKDGRSVDPSLLLSR